MIVGFALSHPGLKRNPHPPQRILRGIVAAVLLAACATSPDGGPPTPTTTLPAPATRPVTAVPSQTPQPTSPLQGTVSVWVSWEAGRVSDLAQVLLAFQELHPRVQTRLSFVRPTELLEAYRVAAREGQAPTILIGPAGWGPSLFRQGLIVDVATRLLPSQRESVTARLWSQVTDAGAVLGLPVRARGVVLYRNRNLAPQAAPDLETLLRLAGETSVRFASEPVFDLGFSFASSQLTPCGGTVLRAGGGLGFDRAAGICWLELLARFRQAGPLTFNSNADRATFKAGHSPWLIDSADALPEIVAALGADTLSIDDWPAVSEGGPTLSGTVWTDNVYFTLGTPSADLEASWAFAHLLISPEGQGPLAQSEGSWFLPVSRSIQPVNPLAAAASGRLSNATAFPLAADIDVYRIPLERAVTSAAGQAADPAAALDRAIEVITNQLTQSPPGG